MNQSTGNRRAYRSDRRAQQAEATRQAIADAARTLFVARGWAATRVRDVAEAAGVAEPTVFAVYGNKAGLALAVVDSATSTADVQRVEAEVAERAGKPQAQLEAMVAFDRRLFEQAGDVIGMLRDAGASIPELAAAYADGVARGDTARREVFGAWPPGTLREGLDVAGAVDVYAALCNIDVYRVLTKRGWSADRVEAWWAAAVPTLVLAAPRP
jgi:AcrR family transcriptional regulator